MEIKKNTITVDGIEVELHGEKNLLEVIRNAGIDIPTFCYYPELSYYGACRMCVFEDERGRIDTSCSTVPRAGMVIKTNTERLRNYRKAILELILSTHCTDCTLCPKQGSCKLRTFAKIYGLTDIRFPINHTEPNIDNSSKCIVRDTRKCILCGACVRVCDEIMDVGAISFVNRSSKVTVSTAFNKPLAETNCIGCGQCAAYCPTGALVIKNETSEAWKAISDPDKYVTVQIAPAVRVAIGENFGLEAGEDCMGKIVSALRFIGFDEVYDTTVGADMTVLEESAEFLERVSNHEKMPMFTSCCPGWIQYAENNYPELLPQISTCRSPMEMLASVLHKNIDEKAKAEGKTHYHIAVMPCTAKKYEAAREEFDGKVDLVITTVELIKMIRSCNLNFKKLKPSKPDSVYGPTSGAGVIFGVTGGVTEAVLRHVSDANGAEALERISYVGVRGLSGVKVTEIPFGATSLKIAIVSGLTNTAKLIERIEAGEHYDLVEVMACPGGCICGGGQPRPEDFAERVARADALYSSDKKSQIRTSRENDAVAQLLDELGEEKHHLLHVEYGK